MDIVYSPKERERILPTRNGYPAGTLSDPHYNEAMLITGIIEGSIQSTGKFKKALSEYSAAYARTKEKLTDIQAERIIRDMFEARTGMKMNEMRQMFADREENLSEIKKSAALPYAKEIGPMIENGDKISFHRAYAAQAKSCATDLNITDLGAKRIMSKKFEEAHGQSLYEWGKDHETRFYKPQIEALKQARKSQQSQKKSHEYSRS